MRRTTHTIDSENKEWVPYKIDSLPNIPKSFHNIKDSISHGHCGDNPMQTGQRSLTQDRSEGFGRPRQRFGAIHTQPDAGQTPISRNNGMQ
jgi:hypothetical protein